MHDYKSRSTVLAAQEALKSVERLRKMINKARGVRVQAESKPYSLAHHLNVKTPAGPKRVFPDESVGEHEHLHEAIWDKKKKGISSGLELATSKILNQHEERLHGNRVLHRARSEKIKELEGAGAKDSPMHYRYLANSHHHWKFGTSGETNPQHHQIIRDAAVKKHDEIVRKMPKEKQRAYIAAHESLKHPEGSDRRKDAAIGLHHHGMSHEFPQLHGELPHLREAQHSEKSLSKADLLKRPKIVAVDMDGTILDSKNSAELGEPIPGVKKKLDRFKTMGWTVVIWTVREESPEIIAHLKKHEIPFDYFNWHPWQPKGASVKLRADVYLDDRAVPFAGDAKDYDQVLVHKPWWRK